MNPPETSVKDVAALYISKGWQVVPLQAGQKACKDDNWTKIIFKPEDFTDKDNIGIRSVGGLVDLDCDAPEVVALAPFFLPPTEAIYGRDGEARHWLYKSEFEKTIVAKDLTMTGENASKATLVEIRVNHQSMAPPSTHPSGAPVSWVPGKDGEATTVEADDLRRAFRLLATTALLARHYNPPGNRHEWGMSIAGLFKTLGLAESDTIKIFEKAAQFVRDSEIKDRLGAVRATYHRGEDEPTKGSGALKELMHKGEEFVKSIQKIWGTTSTFFIVDPKTEKILANSQENIKRALDKMGAKLVFDDFSKMAMVKYGTYEGPLEDSVRNRIWLDIDREYHFRPGNEFFDIVIKDIADKNKIHPVREYLKGLRWDGQERIDTWLIRSARAADTRFVRKVSALVLIAAVRRVMKPGAKFDEILVLESGQGQFKSSMLRTLCPNPDWFSDDLPLNVDSKQIIERTAGKWIIEAQELSGMRKAQREHLKSMLSRQVDGPVRMAYDRLPVSKPRQFIVIGTTNDHHYLQDPTGNRRYWPMRINAIDINLILGEREQLWAEAAHREAQGESIRLPQELWEHAGVQQERRRAPDPWEEIIESNFCGEEIARVTPSELWMALGIPIERRTDTLQSRLSQIMQKFNFRSMTVKDPKTNKPVRGWGRGNIPGTKSLFIPPKEETETPPRGDEGDDF